MFADGMYAVRTNNNDLGFAFYTECRVAMMRAACEGENVIYFTQDDYENHMELYFNSGISY